MYYVLHAIPFFFQLTLVYSVLEQ